MIIFLVGARGSGKSTIGKILAKKLGFGLRDTDVMICAKANRSVTEIVALEGWAGFRARESEALGQAIVPGRVIATGGGMVLADANRRLMRAKGVVFYLSVPANALHARLCRELNPSQRPSLTGADPLAEIKLVLAARELLYTSVADYSVDGTQPVEAVAEEIVRCIAARRAELLN